MQRSFLLLFLLPLTAAAQRQLSVSINGGFSNYSGDLQEKRFTIDQANATFGVGLSLRVMPKLAIRGDLQYGHVSGDDKKAVRPLLIERNLNFRSKLFEGALLAEYSFSELTSKKKVTPYVFAGGALFRINPYTTSADGRTVYLRNLGTEGQELTPESDKKYKLINISVPFGGGIRLRINENTYLSYEIGLRTTFTDYIDDVSKTYADRDLLIAASGAIAAEVAFRTDEIKADAVYPVGGTTRGGPDFNDWYYFSTIRISIGLMDEVGKLFRQKEGRGSVDCPRPL